MQDEPLKSPPEGYITLRDYCRRHGIIPQTAVKAAEMGNIPGAVRVWVPGHRAPLWWIPENSTWRPNPKGKRYSYDRRQQ